MVKPKFACKLFISCNIIAENSRDDTSYDCEDEIPLFELRKNSITVPVSVSGVSESGNNKQH